MDSHSILFVDSHSILVLNIGMSTAFFSAYEAMIIKNGVWFMDEILYTKLVFLKIKASLSIAMLC